MNETAWLIEADGGLYWGNNQCNGAGWVGINRAVRFARKCDAEFVRDCVVAKGDRFLKFARVTEHMWVKP